MDVSVSARGALRNGAKWEVVRTVEPDTWYTLQVTIDPARKTYSGVVGKPGGDLTAFKDRGVGEKWDGIINTFICDGIGHVAGPARGAARQYRPAGDAFPPPGSPASGQTGEPKGTAGPARCGHPGEKSGPSALILQTSYERPTASRRGQP
ncbi:MAG: hypothetical protein U0840_00445 [Gemmataceae bacterium]